MPEIGDRVAVASSKAARRDGVVIAISGTLLTVRWASGDESSLIPGPGVLSVVAKSRRRKAASPPATATKKSSASPVKVPATPRAATKKAVAKKTPAKKTAAKKAAAKKAR